MVAVSRGKFLTRTGGCKKTDVRYNLPTRLRAACPRTALDNPFREVLKAVGWTVKLTPRGSSGTGMASVPRERSHGGDGHRAGSARQHGLLRRDRRRRGRMVFADGEPSVARGKKRQPGDAERCVHRRVDRLRDRLLPASRPPRRRPRRSLVCHRRSRANESGDRHFKWPSVRSPPPSASLPAQSSNLCGAYLTLRARSLARRRSPSCPTWCAATSRSSCATWRASASGRPPSRPRRASARACSGVSVPPADRKWSRRAKQWPCASTYWQMKPVHTPLVQSALMRHACPRGQGEHDPPQSIAVSLPFWIPSVQVGALQVCVLRAHEPLRQSLRMRA